MDRVLTLEKGKRRGGGGRKKEWKRLTWTGFLGEDGREARHDGCGVRGGEVAD